MRSFAHPGLAVVGAAASLDRVGVDDARDGVASAFIDNPAMEALGPGGVVVARRRPHARFEASAPAGRGDLALGVPGVDGIARGGAAPDFAASIVPISAADGRELRVLADRRPECQAATLERTFEQMTPAERIESLQDLWDRVAEVPQNVPVTDAQRADLRRRVAAFRAEPTSGVPWEQVLERARRR